MPAVPSSNALSDIKAWVDFFQMATSDGLPAVLDTIKKEKEEAEELLVQAQNTRRENEEIIRTAKESSDQAAFDITRAKKILAEAEGKQSDLDAKVKAVSDRESELDTRISQFEIRVKDMEGKLKDREIQLDKREQELEAAIAEANDMKAEYASKVNQLKKAVA